MKRHLKLFIIYFPVVLVSCQVLMNLLSFVMPKAYYAAGFYLNTFFGTNVLFAIFLLCFTLMFRFCDVSRWSAIAEVLFAANYLIVKADNLYNILFQVIVGVIAILLTFRHYINKFPLCRMSLVWRFLTSVSTKGCEKGLEHYDKHINSIILKTYGTTGRSKS